MRTLAHTYVYIAISCFCMYFVFLLLLLLFRLFFRDCCMCFKIFFSQIGLFLRWNIFFSGSRHCASVLQTQVPTLCTNLDLGLIYILILGTFSKFARENNFLALGVCFSFFLGFWFWVSKTRPNHWTKQMENSPARALAASLPRQDHVFYTTDESSRFHNKKTDAVRCKLNSTENLCSFEKYPTPPGGYWDSARLLGKSCWPKNWGAVWRKKL